jgi:Zn finger protein HypA/HybF involved in hydrogenase expression
MKSKPYPKKNNLKQSGNILKCPKCKHEWETKSKLVFVTCPSCQLKVKIEKKKKEDKSDD